MQRKWVKLKNLKIFDDFHYELPDGDFDVDVEKDGNDKEYHRKGIDVIKKVMQNGAKIRPILALETPEGYRLLDGFKRAMAHKELDRVLIEALVCNQKEYDLQLEYDWDNGKVRCFKGGMPYEIFGLYEGYETSDPDNIYFLYNTPGLRIEIRENIHIHWGDKGKYRLELGRRDFIRLAEAIIKIET